MVNFKAATFLFIVLAITVWTVACGKEETTVNIRCEPPSQETLGTNKFLTPSKELSQTIDMYQMAKTGRPDVAPSSKKEEKPDESKTLGTKAVAFTREDGLTSYEGTLAVDIGGMFDVPSVNLTLATIYIQKNKELNTFLREKYGYGIEKITITAYRPEEGKEWGVILFDSAGHLKAKKCLATTLTRRWYFSKDVPEQNKLRFAAILDNSTIMGWTDAGMVVKGAQGVFSQINPITGNVLVLKSGHQYIDIKGKDTSL